MFDMGKRICKLRRDAHLSQKQLGEKIGKSASTIGSYENDTAVPTLENAAALAEALHVSLDYLLYGEKSRTLPLQKMSENRVQLLTNLAQEFAAPTSHGAVVFWGHSKGSQHRRADAEYIRPETNPIQVAFKMEELL